MILAGTGYRPQKIGGFVLPNPTYINICKQTESKLLELNPSLIITGMALGFDQILAFIANKLKIPYLAAVPFENQDAVWNADQKRIYSSLLSKAKNIVVVSKGGYSAAKMQIRNEFMVDSADEIIACISENETSGGTFNCVQYALNKAKKINYIRPPSHL